MMLYITVSIAIDYNEKHIEHVIDNYNGKLHIIEEAKIYEETLAQHEYDLNTLGCATRYLSEYYGKHWRFVRKSGFSTNLEAIHYFQPDNYWRNNRIEHYYSEYKRFNQYSKQDIDYLISMIDCTEEELNNIFNKVIIKFEINSKYLSFIDEYHFIIIACLYANANNENLDFPCNPAYWVNEKYKEEIEQLQQLEAQKRLKVAKQEQNQQLKPIQHKLQLQLDALQQEQEKYKALAAKGQFLFDGLLIQRQKKSTSFLLPNENNAKITAYGIMERLTGNAFKSYRKQEKINNNYISLLPYSERIRLVFYFRQQYKNPPLLDNAYTIAAFINTANKYTDNWELRQNWLACLEATSTPEEAASLFAYYGWAADYGKEYPRTENAFYTVALANGERHYNIVNDDITSRFAAIEHKGRTFEAYSIIANKTLQYSDKDNKLQALFKPLLWRNNDVKMGLITDTRLQCESRISEYIDGLLSRTAFDNIPLHEHINRIEIDKSSIDTTWATPQAFTISMNDIEFIDRQYNINAEYNRTNNADKGMKRAYEKYSRLQGDEWNTTELKAQGYTSQQIINYCKYDWIEEVPEKKIGNLKYYRRILG